MKKILTILCVLLAYVGYSQTIQYLGSPTTQIYVRGQLRVDTILYLPLRDTTFTPAQIGAVVVKGTAPYIWTGTRWVVMATGSSLWGTIAGTLSNQTDLQNALNAKQDAITGGYGIKKSGVTLTFDSAVVRKVDTLIRVNDSTLQYTINGVSHNVLVRGTSQGGVNAIILNANGTPFNDPVTFANSSGSWAGSLVLANQSSNRVWAGPITGSPAQPNFRVLSTSDLPTGIPNANLQNSTITYAGSTAGSDISITPTTVALGGTVTVAIPNAGPAARGALTAADWNTFNGKVTSVNGQTGIVVTKSADSIKALPVDTSSNRNNYVLTFDSTGHKWKLTPGASSGVTSVALTAPSILSVAGSPITGSGTLALTLVNQTGNTVFAAPSGSSGTPTFRAILNADLPTSGVSAGTYNSLTVNAQGIITGATNVGSGITSMNGLSGATQTFATGTSGSDFNISSSGTTHTYNIPSASASNRGLLTSSDWTTFNNKKNNNDSVATTGYASNGHVQKVIDSLLGLADTTVFHSTGVTGVPPFVLTAVGSVNQINFPKYRDTSARQTAYTPDSALAIADHDSTSANALATKYDVDTMRIRIGPGGGTTPGLQAVITAGPNLTGDNTIGLATHKLTISGGPTVVDSIRLQAQDTTSKAKVGTLNGFGDSFLSPGTGSTAQDSVAFYRFGNFIKVQTNNFGASGTGIMTAITRMDSLVTGLANNCMTWLQIGYNDLRASGADGRTPLKVVAGDCAGMVNHFASKYISASDTTTTILRTSGTFTKNISNTSCPIKMHSAVSTTTINDSIMYDWNGRYLGIVMIAGDSATFSHSIVNIFLDYTLYKTVNTNGIADGTAVVAGHTDSRIPYGVVVDAGSTGLHHIKLVNTQARIMMVDYFAVLSPFRPTFMLLHTIYPVASPTVYQNLNNAIDSMRGTWPTAFPVIVPPINDFFNRTTGLFTDNTHPNNTGYFQEEQSVEGQWNAAIGTSVGQQLTADASRVFFFDNGKEPMMNAKDVLTRAEPAVNFPGYVSVGLGMSYKINGIDVFKPDVANKNYSIGNGAGITMTQPAAIGNNWFGDLAGNTCTTCANNAGLGTGSMQLITTGTANAAYGNFSLQNLSTGGSNTAGGHQSLHSNTTGSSNTANGQNALGGNTTASNNTANGASALAGNTTGTGNTGTGFQALLINTTSNFNTADGDQALVSNSTGAQNTSSGAFSTAFNTTGIGNAVVGYKALYGNASTAAYNYNTANGYQAGQYNHGDSNIYQGAFVAQTALATTYTGHGSYFIGTITDTPRTSSSNGDISEFNATITGNAAKRSLAINVPIGSQTTSAQFEVGGTTGAVLIPRLNTTQMNALTPTAGMEVYNIDSAGYCIYSTAWNKVLTSVTGNASSGSYVPTMTGTNHISTITPDSAFFVRIGNIVEVTGSCTVAASATGGGATFDISLPVSSHLGGTSVAGVGANNTGLGYGIVINGHVATANAQGSYSPSTTSSDVIKFHFTYIVQ